MSQLLHDILTYLPLRTLYRVAYVFHRFPLASIASQVVHARLKYAVGVKDHKVMLECYHPSAQYSAPWLLCDYLETPGLDDPGEATRSLCKGDGLSQLRGLRGRYLHFRPRRREHAAPSSPQNPSSLATSDGSHGKTASRKTASTPAVTNLINLDTHELFSQLCVRTDLVKLGPREGVFSSIVDLCEKVILRIWREWLDERAEEAMADRSFLGLDNAHKDKILWLDDDENFGIQVRVFERMWHRPTPVLYHKDEDQAVSFDLQLESKFI